MIPKKKRVTKEVFQVLMKEGKTLSTQLFLFYFKKNENPQYAFVAPKKIFKNASKRNKFRRAGYNILRTIPLEQGLGVFLFKKEAINANIKDVKENILYLLKKVGFID